MDVYIKLKSGGTCWHKIDIAIMSKQGLFNFILPNYHQISQFPDTSSLRSVQWNCC